MSKLKVLFHWILNDSLFKYDAVLSIKEWIDVKLIK